MIKDFASCEAWTHAQENFKNYIQSRAPHVKDVWGTAAEERHGQVLVSLVRVATDQREASRGHADDQFEPGKKGVGHYDFYERSDKDAGYPAVINTIQELGSTSGGWGGGERTEGGEISEEDVPIALYTTGSVGKGLAEGGEHAAGSSEAEVAFTTYTSVDGQPVRRQARGEEHASDTRKWFGPAGSRVAADACSAASRTRQLHREATARAPERGWDTETGTHAMLEEDDVL